MCVFHMFLHPLSGQILNNDCMPTIVAGFSVFAEAFFVDVLCFHSYCWEVEDLDLFMEDKLCDLQKMKILCHQMLCKFFQPFRQIL